jgi:lipopolysaccharide heptosyltransferase II
VARSGVRHVAFLAITGLAYAYRLARPRKVPTHEERHVRSLLLIRLDLMGDVLFSLTAAASLREAYPGAHITMLTLPYTAPLACLSPDVDEVLSVDSNRIRTMRGLLAPQTWLAYLAVYRRLRSRRFDLAVSLCGRMASLWAFLSGARWTVGFAGEAYPFLLNDPVPGRRYDRRMPESEYVKELTLHAGGSAVSHEVSLPVPDHARSSVEKMLRELGLDTTQPLVVVHPGAGNGSAKRWPAVNWARFSDAIAERTGAGIILAGGSSDLELSDDVRRSARRPLVSLVGQTSLEEVAALLERADLVASSDSGPLHLAVALETPVVAVYGPTDPQIHGPYRPVAPAVVHRHDLPCSPCYSMAAVAECPLGDPICMRLVSVQQMVESTVRLLNDRGRR